jgi:hypothetical protein
MTFTAWLGFSFHIDVGIPVAKVLCTDKMASSGHNGGGT